MQQRRTPGRSRPQVDSINYTDCESETESSAVLSDGEIDFSTDTTDYTLETLWTPGTFKTKVEVAEGAITDIAKPYREQHGMAKQTESGIEKMMQMFLQMRQDDKDRENRRLREERERR